MSRLLMNLRVRVIRIAAIIITVSLAGSPVTNARSEHTVPRCEAAAPLVRIPELPEASGVAVSRHSPGRLTTIPVATPCSWLLTLEGPSQDA